MDAPAVVVRPVLPNIFRAEYGTLYDLAMAFVRMQEWADGARFHRTVFELDDFIADWCARKGDGAFTYPQRWNGYNLSGTVLTQWLEAVRQASSLRPKEQALLSALKGSAGPPPWTGLYLFGVCEEEGPAEKDLVTEHECAHAFYALQPRYRQVANSLLGELPRDYLTRAEAVLRGKGYHRSAFPDEIQAYLSTGDRDHGVLGLRTLGSKRKHLDTIDRFQDHYADWRRRLSAG